MVEPIDVEFLKRHCRLTTDVEDDLLAVYIPAARQTAEAYCRTQFVSQLVSKKYPIYEVPSEPLVSVVSVSGYFTDVAQIPTDTTWWAEYVKGVSIERSLPLWYARQHTYTISYQVTVAPADVPAAVKVAIAKIAAELYENRESSGEKVIGVSYQLLLAPYRKF